MNRRNLLKLILGLLPMSWLPWTRTLRVVGIDALDNIIVEDMMTQVVTLEPKFQPLTALMMNGLKKSPWTTSANSSITLPSSRRTVNTTVSTGPMKEARRDEGN